MSSWWRAARVNVEALIAHARGHIPEQAAVPKHLEILAELPKTAVGKVFKPDLRRRAIAAHLWRGAGAGGVRRAGGGGGRGPQARAGRGAGAGRAGRGYRRCGRGARAFLTPWRWRDDAEST